MRPRLGAKLFAIIRSEGRTHPGGREVYATVASVEPQEEQRLSPLALAARPFVYVFGILFGLQLLLLLVVFVRRRSAFFVTLLIAFSVFAAAAWPVAPASSYDTIRGSPSAGPRWRVAVAQMAIPLLAATAILLAGA